MRCSPTAGANARTRSYMKFILSISLAIACSCYGSAHGGLARASAAWRSGDRARAVGEAEAMYQRFAADNPEATARAVRLLPSLRESLAERPIMAPNAAGPARAPEHGEPPNPARAFDPDADLRARLLSLDAADTLTAIASVEGLGLGRHAEGLLVIVDRRDGWTDSSDLTAGLDVGTRSMLVKTMALDALRALAVP